MPIKEARLKLSRASLLNLIGIFEYDLSRRSKINLNKAQTRVDV